MASIYQALPKSERTQAVVLAYKYGEASTINYFGSKLDCHQPLAGTTSMDCQPRAMSGQVAVAIGFSERELRPFYDEVTPEARVSPDYAIPEESQLSIFVCQHPREPPEIVGRSRSA